MSKAKKIVLPTELEFHISDVLVPDTGEGEEKSATGRMVKAYLEDRLGPAHLPVLVEEARHCIEVMEDGVMGDLHDDDETPEAAKLRGEYQELERFVKKYA